MYLLYLSSSHVRYGSFGYILQFATLSLVVRRYLTFYPPRYLI